MKHWNEQINALELFFGSIEIPTNEVLLSRCETINNVPLFISSHLEMVKANNGKQTFTPYLERLEALKMLLQ